MCPPTPSLPPQFEGDEYRKVVVRVRPADAGPEAAEVAAWAYLWAEGKSDALYGTWDYAAFRAAELPAYVASCRQFGAAVRGSRSAAQLTAGRGEN